MKIQPPKTNSGVDPANTHYAFPNGLQVEFASSLLEEFERFQGVWCGTWGGYVPLVLVIDKVRFDGTARFVYAWGDSIHGVKNSKEGQFDLRDQLLTVDFPGGVVEFHFASPHGLFGIYREGDAIQNCITMTRIAHACGSDSIFVEHLRVPVDIQASTLEGMTPCLYSTIYRDSRRTSAPLLLLNHGSAGGRLGPAVTYLYDAQARYFVTQGFTVAVPMRRGRGKSDGPFIETARHDTADAFALEVSAGVADVSSILHHFSAIPWVSDEPCILAGQSRGGYLSLVCAAAESLRVRAVINFSGGWWSEDTDVATLQLEKLKELGAGGTAPTIWLYGEEDCFYGPTYVQQMHDSYQRGGGSGVLHLYESNGHSLIDYMHVWREAVRSFLEALT